MTTKQTQTSQQRQNFSQSGSNNASWANQYAPGSMESYQALQGSYIPALQGIINNPFNNPLFNSTWGMQQAQLGASNNAAVRTLTNNMAALGGASSPFMASQLARQNRAFSGSTAGAYNNLLMNTWQQRMQALQMAGAYNPLVTGGNQSQNYSGKQSGTMRGNQTQTTSGLGTWLPSLLSTGLGFASGGLFGGKGGGGFGMPNPSSLESSPGSPFLQGITNLGIGPGGSMLPPQMPGTFGINNMPLPTNYSGSFNAFMPYSPQAFNPSTAAV